MTNPLTNTNWGESQPPVSEDPKPVLKDDALYIGDNGRVYHGRCAGQTARYTGRDLRGAKVLRIPNTEIQAEPDLWTCEKCEWLG